MDISILYQLGRTRKFLVRTRNFSCPDKKSFLSGQETILSGQESFLSGQESILSGQDSFLSGQEVFLSGQESFLSGQESFLSGQDSFLSGQEKKVGANVPSGLPYRSPVQGCVARTKRCGVTPFAAVARLTNDESGESSSPYHSTSAMREIRRSWSAAAAAGR
jgi:hypothetical protein